MTDLYAGRASAQRRMVDADQTEQAAMRSGTAIFDAGVYDQRIAGAMDDFAPTGVDADAAWQRQDLEVDTAVGHVHEEILRRAALMGTAYPFELSENKISYRPSETGFYEFCLAVSLTPSLTSGEFAKLPRLFERSVATLIKKYFGVHTKALHVGKPRDAAVGTTFKKAMETLNQQSKEWIWTTYPDLPDDPSTSGDEGMDFVVWKETLDQRNGRLFVIGQCACGDDWHSKFEDVSLSRLGKWFHPLSYTQPLRAFTTPRHIATAWLDEALGRAGLVFDRARLGIIAGEDDAQKSLSKWKAQFGDLRQLVLDANASINKSAPKARAKKGAK